MKLTYLLHDLATRQYWGDVTPYLSGVTFDDPVGSDEYGTWSASLRTDAIQDASLRSRLAERLVKDRTWVLVLDPGTREILWSGVLRSKPWNRANRARMLSAVQLPWWLHNRLTGTGRSPRVWTNTDRLVIARQLVAETQGGRYGDPAVAYDAALSGKKMNYRVDARSFSSIASHLSEIARGRDGFEWDLITEWSPVDGLPRLRFVAVSPEITNAKIHLFHYGSGQSNLLTLPEQWPDSAEGAYARVWATGEGSGAAQNAQADSDPFTRGSGYRPAGDGSDWRRLLTEKVSSYSGVRLTSALIANAREERLALEKITEPVTVTVSPTRPKFSGYGKGSRVHLIIQDGELDIDEPDVRVINVRYSEAGAASAAGSDARVELTLDLNDVELPDGLAA